MSDLKLGDTDLANMLGAFFPGYMITQIPSGPIIQKYGGKPLLLLVMLGRGTPLASRSAPALTGRPRMRGSLSS